VEIARWPATETRHRTSLADLRLQQGKPYDPTTYTKRQKTVRNKESKKRIHPGKVLIKGKRLFTKSFSAGQVKRQQA